MGYFATGCPKTYILPEHRHTVPPAAPPPESPPHHVHGLHLDPSERYLLTVSARALHIWSATHHRVLLARFLFSPTVLREEGPVVDAVWSPDSAVIIAALTSGLVLLFSVAPFPSHHMLVFDLPHDTLVQPPPLHPLTVIRFAELRVAHADKSVSALAVCPAGALIATTAADLVCVAWDADTLWRAHLPELLRHNNALAKMGVPSAGSESPHPVVAEILQGESPDDGGGIISLVYDRDLAFCGVVFGSGPAFLLAMHSAGRVRPSAIDGRWLRTTDGVCIALEPRRMLATVALRSGDIEQYYIGVPAGDACPLMRTLSLSNWYFEPTDVGSAVVMQWTRDGFALVVGWEKRGLAVWSVSGCRLMWTLPQVGGALPTTPALRNRDFRPQASIQAMEQGVMAAAWGPQGLFLWAAPRFTSESPVAMELCHMLEFSFLKSISAGSFCQSDSSRIAMLGSDRALLLWHADGNDGDSAEQSGIASSDLFAWQHLLIPHDYLWRNWPPIFLTVSSDAAYVAVAGEHGVALCHIRSQRWRVFGDIDQGRRIKCCALAWVGKTVVIGNETAGSPARPGQPSKKTYELLFYQRDQEESSALQAQRKLPSKPVLSDVRADGYLLIICEDSRVFLFKMTEHYNKSRVDLREIYSLLLPTREGGPKYRQDQRGLQSGDELDKDGSPPAPGGGLTEAKIFPPLTHVDEGGVAYPPTHVMLLRSTGSLILLDTERMVSTALLRYVERFWYTPVDCTPFDMISHRPIWWAYGDDGLHVCFQDGLSKPSPADSDVDGAFEFIPGLRPVPVSRKKKVEVEQWFELDPEVYPLSIMSKYGMLLGATQGLVSNAMNADGVAMPSHVVQVKRLPILHTLLRHLLMKPMSDERVALQIALKCIPQPQFVDSLEWLLYEAVLEHDDDSVFNGGENISLPGLDAQEKRLAERAVQHAAIAQGFPESPRRRKAGSDLFPRVIRLLKYFGEYEDIVVRCARKLDSKRWPLLFSLAGEPAALLEQCFVSGRLRTAACLLVILQEMWGFISSTPHSLRLVQAALSRGELDLAADLANFLSKADSAGMLNSSQLRTSEDVSWIAEAVLAPKASALSKVEMRRDSRSDEQSDRIPAVDLAVLHHAGTLLNKMDLRNLVALAVKMDFPLVEFLKRQLKGKNASRPFVRDFGTTILSLHRQFQYAEPELSDVRRSMRKLQDGDSGKVRPVAAEDRELSALIRDLGMTLDDADVNGTGKLTGGDGSGSGEVLLVRADGEADKAFGTRLPPPPAAGDSELMVGMRAKARVLCEQELVYMMTVARVARSPDVTLCCATLLLDIAVLRMVLRAHEELFGPFVAALNEFGVAGYDALAGVLTEIAVPK